MLDGDVRGVSHSAVLLCATSSYFHASYEDASLPSLAVGVGSTPSPIASIAISPLVPALGEQEDFALGPLSRVELDSRMDVFQRETSLDVGLKLGGEEFLDAAG